MRRSPLLATALVAGLTLPAAAHAQVTGVDDDGALQILTGLKTWITRTVLTPGQDVSLRFDGPISVEPAGDRYQVDIPVAMIGDEHGASVRVGDASITLTPTPRGWFETTVRFPDQFVIVEAERGDIGEVTIGSQRGSGLFVPALQSFVASDFLLESIRVAPYDQPGQVTVGQVGMVGDYVEDEAGRSDMDFELFVRDIQTADIPDLQFEISEIAFGGVFGGVLLDDYLAFVEEAGGLIEASGMQHGLEPPAEILTGLATLIAEAPALLANMGAEYSVSGLTVSGSDLPGVVTLDSVNLRTGTRGLDQDTSEISLRFEMDSLSVPGVPLVSQMLPSYAAFDYDVLGVPNAAIVDSLVLFLNAASDVGMERAADGALQSLGNALIQSGGEVRLNTLEIVSETMSLKVDGRLHPNPGGLIPVRFNATVELGGLPIVRTALLPWIDDEDAAAALDVLETIGEAVTDERGREVLRYEVVSTPDGSVTINGRDADELLRFLNI